MKQLSVRGSKVVFGCIVVLGIVFGGMVLGATSVVLDSKLTPPSTKDWGPMFGHGVAISGNTAVILAPRMCTHATSGESDIGYVFVRTGSTWSVEGRLTLLTSVPVATSYCGFCHVPHRATPSPWPLYNTVFDLAASGDTAIVGGGSGYDGYRVHAFERSSGTWTHRQEIVMPAGADDTDKPMPIAVQGDTIALGSLAGSARVVDVHLLSGGTWTLQQNVVPDDAAAVTTFGQALDVSGDTLAVSGADTANNAVYVFVRSIGGWSQQEKIVLPSGTAAIGAWFPVAVSGDTLLVGAPTDSATGAAYIYTRSGGVWSPPQKLVASDAAAGKQFGYSVTIDGDKAVIGAAADRVAYLFAPSGGLWEEKEKILPPSGGALFDVFPLSISGDTVVIGAAGDSEGGVDAGAAYVYSVNAPVDLSLSKADNVDPAPLDGTITYTLTVTNLDTAVEATGVTVTDTLPAGLTYLSASAGCSASGNIVTCIIGAIPAGNTSTVMISVRADSSGTMTNTASVTADAPDPDLANNTASETTAVNTPPTISAIVDHVVDEDSAITINFTIGDIETAPDALTVSASSSDTALIPNGNLAFSGTGAARTLTITPAADQSGSAVITISVSDGQNATLAIFTVTVNPVNDAPNGTDNTVTTLENTDYTFGMVDFGFSDVVENHAFQAVHITTEPGAGTLTNNTVPVNAGDIISTVDIAAGNLTFTPASNESGIGYTSFTFQVQDDGGTANGGVDLDPIPNTMAITVLNTPTCTLPTECPDGVQVTPIPDVTVTFTTVTAAGQTSGYETAALPTGCPGTENFKFDTLGTCYDVSTTAQYNPPVEVCFTVSHDVSDPALKIMHFNEQLIPPDWEDVTTTRDISTNTICGNVDSFSWFVLGLDTPLLQGQAPLGLEKK